MIEHNRLGACPAGNALHDGVAVLELELWHASISGDWKNIEMTQRRGDFIADDRRKVRSHALATRRSVVVNVPVVFCGNRQLDSFAGDRHHTLVEGCVAVPRIGERVDVGSQLT